MTHATTDDGGARGGEAVATVKRLLSGTQPFALVAACVAADAVARRAYVSGDPTVVIGSRSARVGDGLIEAPSAKFGTTNYMGTTSVKGAGSGMSAKQVPAVWGHKAQAGEVRGIPPRGRPV
jgi:hypothetical protein